MFGCGACADPYMRVNFILSSIGEGTQVVAQYWMVIPKLGGSEERMDDTSNRDFNDAQNLLWKLRDQYVKTP